ncbi:hypothetical protein M9H77_32256 [Catharanthus roseus]|uniref:Uncharacterized protein n=1 Tax=Catharanthus roseus TaxID=4058 RepID=A0ACC0A394_CATRO|nr:hypothetical protein M9H77_32256 [Catharanthus roseus]
MNPFFASAKPNSGLGFNFLQSFCIAWIQCSSCLDPRERLVFCKMEAGWNSTQCFQTQSLVLGAFKVHQASHKGHRMFVDHLQALKAEDMDVIIFLCLGLQNFMHD